MMIYVRYVAYQCENINIYIYKYWEPKTIVSWWIFMNIEQYRAIINRYWPSFSCGEQFQAKYIIRWSWPRFAEHHWTPQAWDYIPIYQPPFLWQQCVTNSCFQGQQTPKKKQLKSLVDFMSALATSCNIARSWMFRRRPPASISQRKIDNENSCSTQYFSTATRWPINKWHPNSAQQILDFSKHRETKNHSQVELLRYARLPAYVAYHCLR